jgi:hypothetical protein
MGHRKHEEPEAPPLGITAIYADPDGRTRVVWDDGVVRIYDLAR